MVDFLTTDWTHKIKTNPVANMILNSNRSIKHRIRLRQLTHLPGRGKYITDGFLQNFYGPVYRDEIVDDKKLKEIQDTFISPEEMKTSYNSAVIADLGIRGVSEDGKVTGVIPGSGIAMASGKDASVVAIRGGAGDGSGTGDEKADGSVAVAVPDPVFPDDDDFDDAESINDPGDRDIIYDVDEIQEGDMWANVFVDDFINIHHPKLRHHYINDIASKPLHIKPPSVFFSNV